MTLHENKCFFPSLHSWPSGDCMGKDSHRHGQRKDMLATQTQNKRYFYVTSLSKCWWNYLVWNAHVYNSRFETLHFSCQVLDHHNLQGHSSHPIQLHIHKMTFDILHGYTNSYPNFYLWFDVEWRSLNYAFSYDVIRAHIEEFTWWVQITHTHHLRSPVIENGGLWTMPSVMMLY